MFDKLLPRIAPDYRSRFRETLDQASFTSLTLGVVLLAICFAAESFSQQGAFYPRFFWYPCILSVVHTILSVGLLSGIWRPKHAGLWQFAAAMSAYSVSLLNADKATTEQLAGYFMLELVGLCVFIPYGRLCLIGGTIIGSHLFFNLYADHTNSLAEAIGYWIPTMALAAFAYLGRQSGLRRAFLKEMENEEVNQELRLSKLALDQTSHYVLWLDEFGKVQFGNESLLRALGYSADELLTYRLDQLTSDFGFDEWTELLAQLQKRGAHRRQMRIRGGSGHDILVEVQFDLVDAGNRQVICGVAVDLTERRRMDQEIQHVQKLEGLGTLAGGVAHDYNNLLVPIISNATFVLGQLHESHAAKRPVQDIILASERAAALTEQLLVYTGIGNAEPKPISISSELDSIAEILRSSLVKGTQLQIFNEIETSPILGESAQVHQVLLNLVLNAGQAIGKENGRIQVSLDECELDAETASSLSPRAKRPAGRYVTCAIADNGCGMNSETRERMFDPFYTSKPNGRGLGLSAVLGIMKNHGGGIHVESAVGIGTEITVYLPAHVGEMVGEVKDARVLSGDGELVLFVDDEPLIRGVGETVLAAYGFQVMLAESGDEAIELFQQHADSIGVVVLDNRMPGPGMLATVSAIRSRKPGVPVIASSGFPSEIPKILKNGENRVSFLQKPYSADALAGAVCDAVDQLPQNSERNIA